LSYQLVLTASPEFISSATREAKKADPEITLAQELSEDIVLLSGARAFPRFSANLREQEPVFTRHICPVQQIISIEERASLGKHVANLPEAAELLAQGTFFSMQGRVLEAPEGITPYALRELVVPALVEKYGAVEQVKTPEVVVSVLANQGQLYIGLSRAEDNLSNWTGGMRRFARTSQQISRAEFKLLEAQEVFNKHLPHKGRALDLGAAPGGWTRLLLEAGLEVVAVDPADLDPRLSNQPRLRHYRGYASDYLRQARRKKETFGVILSDMRVDTLEAANLLGEFAELLAPGGFALTTLKLPHATPKINPVGKMEQALHLLRQNYRTVRARQLFHNRQEVTVCLS
jgi:23S rRNA (cytidine2498-2'-O)-methyltransferase